VADKIVIRATRIKAGFELLNHKNALQFLSNTGFSRCSLSISEGCDLF